MRDTPDPHGAKMCPKMVHCIATSVCSPFAIQQAHSVSLMAGISPLIQWQKIDPIEVFVFAGEIGLKPMHHNHGRILLLSFCHKPLTWPVIEAAPSVQIAMHISQLKTLFLKYSSVTLNISSPGLSSSLQNKKVFCKFVLIHYLTFPISWKAACISGLNFAHSLSFSLSTHSMSPDISSMRSLIVLSESWKFFFNFFCSIWH